MTTLLDGQIRCIDCHAPLDFQILADGCIYVKPCSACMNRAYDEGYDDGYSEGFDEGFDSA